MDYEKKYRDLVEAVKELQKANPSDDGIQNWIKDNVPELIESESERTRKEIINYFQCQSQDEPSRKGIHNKWIAWLEKQGEQNQLKKIEQEYHCTGVREPKEATGVLKQLLNKENYAWSEEDEAYRVDILVKLEPHITDDNFTDVQNWFKSLKERYTWKPSEEQMDALETAVSSLQSTALESLYNELKKL